MQAAEGTEKKRRRGGQPGNVNRLRHGRYSRAWLARRDAHRLLRRRARYLIARIGNVARARAALRRKLARRIAAPPPASALSPRARKQRPGRRYFPRRIARRRLEWVHNRGGT